jgi:hypothetical protein
VQSGSAKELLGKTINKTINKGSNLLNKKPPSF